MTTEAAAAAYLIGHVMERADRDVVVFNPHELAEVPTIYAFSNVVGGGDGIAYAMAQDGTVLGSHWCSNEGYVPNDLGVLEGCRDDRHEEYRKHYPNGYRMEFVRSDNVKSHAGLMEAFRLNQQQSAVSESENA